MPLTETKIRNAKPKDKQYKLFDSGGLFLIVSPARHGINRICKKYLQSALDPKRFTDINPVHSFRHFCAVRMLCSGDPITNIKNRLGHENLQSTMTYLDMDLSHKQSIQEQFILYNQPLLGHDPKLDELIDWDEKQDTLAWLDTL